ncbi:MAG TPA: hypothetical protein VE860_20220 [Chthoniobacterales bacterium]|jgi:hypothetical protein|nr:hypothetical protein [Chthoniobacterales bacterium]
MIKSHIAPLFRLCSKETVELAGRKASRGFSKLLAPPLPAIRIDCPVEAAAAGC